MRHKFPNSARKAWPAAILALVIWPASAEDTPQGQGCPAQLAVSPSCRAAYAAERGAGAAAMDAAQQAINRQAAWDKRLVDTSGDGTADATILDAASPVDTDGDGVRDVLDAFPNDATETTDTDGDGVGDNADAFPNDATETVDTDGDGVGDNADAFPNDATETIDTDGDGVGDNADAFPNDASETTDSDGDGLGNNQENALGTNPNLADSDGDGLNDPVEIAMLYDPLATDSDGDGTADGSDSAYGFYDSGGVDVARESDNTLDGRFLTTAHGNLAGLDADDAYDSWADFLSAFSSGTVELRAGAQSFTKGYISADGLYSATVEPRLLLDFDREDVAFIARASANFGDFGSFSNKTFASEVTSISTLLTPGAFTMSQLRQDGNAVAMTNSTNGDASKSVYLFLDAAIYKTGVTLGDSSDQVVATGGIRLLAADTQNFAARSELRGVQSDLFQMLPFTD